jgi:hypothetical protein
MRSVPGIAGLRESYSPSNDAREQFCSRWHSTTKWGGGSDTCSEHWGKLLPSYSAPYAWWVAATSNITTTLQATPVCPQIWQAFILYKQYKGGTFWEISSPACCLHHSPEDGGSTHLWNVGRHSIKNTAVHPRRFWASATLWVYVTNIYQLRIDDSSHCEQDDRGSTLGRAVALNPASCHWYHLVLKIWQWNSLDLFQF